MKTALLQVKEELGVDAVIMSNKKVAGGVEIVAAVDGDTAPAPAKRYNSQPRHGYNQVSPRSLRPRAESWRMTVSVCNRAPTLAVL